MYKVKGARGSEVVPNAGFWKELPILIKVVSYSNVTIFVHKFDHALDISVSDTVDRIMFT